jgi:ATP-dependent DNA helicase PIF1
MVKYQDLANDGWLAVILAPTGMAAFNINGITIHRCFKLPIFTKSSKNHWTLSNSAIKLIRQFVKNIKIIIIGIFSY